MGIFHEVLWTCIICFVSLNVGVMVVWPSATLKIFESANTTLHRPMSETELALFGSLSSIGAMVSTPIAGYCLDTLGRKYSTMLSALCFVISWATIATSNKVEIVLTAIFIGGLGCSAPLMARVFISDICRETTRGIMTTGSLIFYSLGLLVSYVLGGCFEYQTMVYTSLSLAVFGTCLLGVLKESPTYLMKKGLEEDAAKSFAYYRNAKVESKEILEEMEKLKRAFNPDFEEELTSEEEKLNPMIKKTTEKLSTWNFIKKSQSTRRAIVITLTLVTLANFQGYYVVQVFAKPLFEEAIPTISAMVCSILQAVISVAAGFTAGYLSDFSGRRPLIIYSSVAAGLCCILLATQLQFHWAPHWLTAVLIYLFCATYTFGAGTVPFVLVADVFLPEIKSFMSMLMIEWVWLCSFLVLFIFNPLVTAVGLGAVFYLFALMCILTAVFSIIYLPETKGLTVDVVQKLFVKR